MTDDDSTPGQREQEHTPSRDDFDSPWKQVLERFFEPFLGLLFPQVHAAIDWSHEPEFLDKQLQKLGSPGQRRDVDKLARVWRRGGTPARLFVHVEVQAQREAGLDFERRMFVYHYRLFDRDEHPVVSVAVLADPSPTWRPDCFTHELCGCGVRMWFPVAKLKDLESRWQELAQSDNPFAMVVMAHLKTQATQGKPDKRARWKLALCRMLLERGWSRDDILDLYKFIDWLMALPEDLQQQHEETLEEEKMTHLTVWERRGMEKGIEKGRQEGIEEGRQEDILAALEVRFGAVPGPIDQAVRAVSDAGLLSDLLRQAIKASSLEAFEAVLRERAIG